MRFSLYLTLRLNILCAAPVFYHSIYLESIWSILCTLRHVPMTVNLNCILECILECMYGERMYAKRKLALLHVHFDSVNVSYYYCKCFRVQRVSKQFIIFASCLNCPSLHRNILRFGICHSEILNQNLSNFSIIPNYFS